MSFKVTFTISILDKPYKIDAYAIEFAGSFPSRFQIFVNGHTEGFIYPEGDNWLIDKYSLSQNVLNENLAQEVGNYLTAYYS